MVYEMEKARDLTVLVFQKKRTKISYKKWKKLK
jgi:hypothetical protein